MKVENAAKTNNIPRLDADPYVEDVLTDPYEYYEQLRDAGPIVWLEKHKVLTTGRYKEAREIFEDWESFVSSRGVGINDFKKEKPWRPPSLVLETDPPEHSRARKVIARTMSPKIARELRDSFADYAEVITDELIDKKSFDAMTDLAIKFPLKVFPDAVGLGNEGRENLLTYGSMVFNSFGPENTLRTESLANAQPVVEWISQNCQRDVLSSDGLGAMIYDAIETGELSEDEAPLLVRSFLSAGIDTTVNGLGNVMLCLARYPDQWALLADNPKLARKAFEEALRFESPVHSFYRTTNRPVQIGGHDLDEGHKVLVSLAAANRDPRHWDAPEEYRIERNASGHMAFGAGVHACVGQSLARLEADVLLSALAKKVQSIELQGEPIFEPNNSVRGLRSLPLSITPK